MRYRPRNPSITFDCLCVEIYARRYRITAYMRTMRTRVLAAVVLVATVCCVSSVVRRGRSDYIEYRGEKIKLSKSYLDYDSYKNDPDNIDPSETARVQQLVLSAQIKRQYPTRLAVFQASSEVAFPGYGSGGMGDVTLPDGDTVTGFSVEIPRLEKERYFIFRSRDGVYTLVDDFVANEPLLIGMRAENDELVFLDVKWKPALRRKLNAP
jgi:hypothetical protein